jgi:pSer/pThr/pTyr-binding forkhead associated (FHA) protein
VICGTCGRDNASHLVFCQDCGARLGPRVAAPTPPIGLTQDGIGALLAARNAGTHAAAQAQQDARLPQPSEPTKPRPSAPDFHFGPRDDLPPMQPVDDPPEKTACSNCGATNGPTLRFCITCGNDLSAQVRELSGRPAPVASAPIAGPVAHGPTPVAPAPPRPPPPMPSASPVGTSRMPAVVAPAVAARAVAAPADAAPAEAPVVHPPLPTPPPAPPIVPMAPVDLGPKPLPMATVRVCARCRGVCETGAQFCKFCGAALHDPPVPSTPVLRGPNPQPAAPITQAVAQGAPAPRPTPGARPTPAAPRRTSSAPQVPPMPPIALAPPPPLAPLAPPLAPPTERVAAGQSTVSSSTTPGARLIVIAKDGGEGASFPIGERLDIGRSEGEVVVADDLYLSPRHARLFWNERTLFLRDLGSTNGVFLKLPLKKEGAAKDAGGVKEGHHETVRGAEVPLRDQDLILLGQQVIRFEVVKDAEEGFGPAVQHGTLLFGTPTAPRYARLCQRTVEGVTRDIFYVRKIETVLGRESGDIVFTEDPFLSRRHAVLRVDTVKKTFTLADHGSSNGTFLQIRSDVSVSTGDEFRVGQQLFRVDLTTGTAHGNAGSVS